MPNYRYLLKDVVALDDSLYFVLLVPVLDKLNYAPGQYFYLLDKGVELPFSIGNSPNKKGELELYIRYEKPGDTLEKLIKPKQSNTEFLIKGPFGQCTYPQKNKKNLLFLAGGTGIAPVKALIESMVEKGTSAEAVYLYWGVRDTKELFLNEVIAEWQKKLPQLQYIPVISCEQPLKDWTGKTGWVHEVALQEFATFSDFEVYAFGPLPMLKKAWASFPKNGLDSNDFYTDIPLEYD